MEWKKYQIGNVCLFIENKEYFLLVYADDIKMAGKKQNLAPMWKKLMNVNRMLTNLHHLLTSCIWDALSGNANQIKPSLNRTQKFSNHVFLLEQQRRITGWQTIHAQTAAWSCDMERHAHVSVEQYFELANKKTEQLYKVSSPCLDDHQFKQEELKSVGELSEVCSQKCLEMLALGTNWTT